MKYPRTPRSKWLTVKVNEEDAEMMKYYYDGGYSLSEIGRWFKISHHTVQRYADPDTFWKNQARGKHSRVPPEKSAEYTKRAKERKLALMKDKLNEYAREYLKERGAEINRRRRAAWVLKKDEANRKRREKRKFNKNQK